MYLLVIYSLAAICVISLFVKFWTQNTKATKIGGNESSKKKKKVEPDEDYEDFDSFFSVIRRDITIDEKFEPLIQQVKKRYDKVLMNTVVDGKKFRGIAVLKCYKSFAEKDTITEEGLRMSYAYGWHLEMLQAGMLIYDDIMDKSITRRGKECWYLKNKNGVKAIDDGSFLRIFSFYPLQKYCSSHPCYAQLIGLNKEILNKTTIGQVMDCYTTPENEPPRFDLLTEERYDTVVSYKTSYYTFVLPIRAALYIANITDAKIHADVEEVLLSIGFLFQAQDDYLDVYGDPKVTGKIGTDIEDGKCTWIAVQAYKRMDAKSRKLFEDNFGRKERVSVIKHLFDVLKMEIVFKEFENEKYNEIQNMITDIETKHNLNMKSVRKVLDLVYNRSK